MECGLHNRVSIVGRGIICEGLLLHKEPVNRGLLCLQLDLQLTDNLLLRRAIVALLIGFAPGGGVSKIEDLLDRQKRRG